MKFTVHRASRCHLTSFPKLPNGVLPAAMRCASRSVFLQRMPPLYVGSSRGGHAAPGRGQADGQNSGWLCALIRRWNIRCACWRRDSGWVAPRQSFERMRAALRQGCPARKLPRFRPEYVHPAPLSGSTFYCRVGKSLSQTQGRKFGSRVTHAAAGRVVGASQSRKALRPRGLGGMYC